MTRIALAIVLVFSIALVYNILPINTAVSQDSTSSVDNITAVTLGQENATANATANATIAAALAEANKTLAEAEVEANKTLAEVEANKTLAEAEVEANKTLAEAEVEANKTLAEAEADKTLAEAERRANITQAVARQAFTDLPSSIAGVLGAAIVLVIAVPILTDLLLSHYRQNKQRSLGRPLGMAGLYRSVMAFGLIAVVSILVVYLVALVSFYIAIESPASTALINVLQNLAAILGTALATVIAFYFGVRGAETATDKALEAAGFKRSGTLGQGDRPGPPKITGRYPAKDQNNVGVSTQIVAIFSEPMNSATITKNTFTLRKEGSSVNENVEYVKLETGITAILQPLGDLDKGKKYTVTITKEVEDQTGNKMASDEKWSFTTRNADTATGPGGIST